MAAYDIALANGQGFFSHRVAELCAGRDLLFFLVEPLWAREFLGKLQKGDISVGVLIDMASDPYDPRDLYYRLAREVKAAGGHVIDDPDRSPLATHKGKFHAVLQEHGIRVPETIIVARKDLPRFTVDERVMQRIGVPFVVKPCWGFGGRGVILDARSDADLLRSAALAPESDSFMLQRRIVPKVLNGHPAWFRVFHACGEMIPCWWHPSTGDYELVSPLERHLFGLVAVEQMVFKIAQLSKMEFFSTEIALTEDEGFVAVDYLNDECDLSPKSYHPSGPPDEVVRRVATLMVNKAMTILHSRPFEKELLERDSIWQEHAVRKRAVVSATDALIKGATIAPALPG